MDDAMKLTFATGGFVSRFTALPEKRRPFALLNNFPPPVWQGHCRSSATGREPLVLYPRGDKRFRHEGWSFGLFIPTLTGHPSRPSLSQKGLRNRWNDPPHRSSTESRPSVAAGSINGALIERLGVKKGGAESQ
jgi:hypothetical protein